MAEIPRRFAHAGLVPALFAAETEMQRLGETRDLLVLAVRATKEAIRGLRNAGYSPSPPAVRAFEYAPEPICVWTIGWLARAEYAKVSVEGHAHAARDEMTYLFEELRSTIEGADGNTEVIDKLAPYYDPDTAPYPEGKQELSMQWRGLAVPVLGVGVLALAVAIRRLRSRAEPASEREPEPVTRREPERIYYELSVPEDAPAVVFTHGFALDHETWREQVETFSESHRTLVWDVPGCGDAIETTEPVRFDVASRRLLDVLDDEGIDEGIPEQVVVPRLVVVGEHEYSPIRTKANEWVEELSDSRYETVPDAGHLANHDNPTAFNEILSAFLHDHKVVTGHT